MKQICPIGGLGNRLRSILSYRAVHGEVEVLWAKSPAVCGGWYLEVFEPIPGCTFTDIGTGHAHDYQGDDPSVVTWLQVAEAAPAGWTKGYWDVLPKHAVLHRAASLKAHIDGTYTAIHARRGDHVEHSRLFGHHTDNDELRSWAIRTEPSPLFLSTDCPATQAWFRGHSPGVVTSRIVEDIAPGYENRPGTLFDVAVDLLMCLGAKHFKGSWMSSFSETIELMRWGGDPPGGFTTRKHMPSADAEWYRGRPDRYEEWKASDDQLR